jgi:hypothetical protein
VRCAQGRSTSRLMMRPRPQPAGCSTHTHKHNVNHPYAACGGHVQTSRSAHTDSFQPLAGAAPLREALCLTAPLPAAVLWPQVVRVWRPRAVTRGHRTTMGFRGTESNAKTVLCTRCELPRLPGRIAGGALRRVAAQLHPLEGAKSLFLLAYHPSFTSPEGCRFGDRCNFAHGTVEIRSRPEGVVARGRPGTHGAGANLGLS